MITKRAQKEADYYLSTDPFERARVCEGDYEEWFGFDARGEPCRPDNPILCAKAHYGIGVKMLKESFYSKGLFDWPGGMYILDLPLRMLLEAFTEEEVRGWARELFWWMGYPERSPYDD